MQHHQWVCWYARLLDLRSHKSKSLACQQTHLWCCILTYTYWFSKSVSFNFQILQILTYATSLPAFDDDDQDSIPVSDHRKATQFYKSQHRTIYLTYIFMGDFSSFDMLLHLKLQTCYNNYASRVLNQNNNIFNMRTIYSLFAYYMRTIPSNLEKGYT